MEIWKLLIVSSGEFNLKIYLSPSGLFKWHPGLRTRDDMGVVCGEICRADEGDEDWRSTARRHDRRRNNQRRSRTPRSHIHRRCQGCGNSHARFFQLPQVRCRLWRRSILSVTLEVDQTCGLLPVLCLFPRHRLQSKEERFMYVFMYL